MQNKVQPTTRSRSKGVVKVFPVVSKRVLVADEDPAFLRRVTEVIDHNGFRAVSACNGGEALRILCSVIAVLWPRFSLAVAMSDLDGPECAHEDRKASHAAATRSQESP